MRKNQFYKDHLETLPEGMRKAVAGTLLKHRGAEKAIQRSQLVYVVSIKLKRFNISSKQFANLDRTIRKAIENLRADGWLIGSSLDGGYYMITTREEYEAFKDQYMRSAYQQIKTAQALDLSARQLFGDPNPGGQIPLITGEAL